MRLESLFLSKTMKMNEIRAAPVLVGKRHQTLFTNRKNHKIQNSIYWRHSEPIKKGQTTSTPHAQSQFWYNIYFSTPPRLT